MISKEFFTKQRKALLLLSGLFALVCLIVAYAIPSANIFNSIFSNLSASGIVTGFTVTYIDYLLATEKKLSTARAKRIADGEIGAILISLRSQLSQLYGFDYSTINFKSSPYGEKVDNFLVAMDEAIFTHLNQMSDKQDSKKIVESRIGDTRRSLEDAVKRIDTILQRYGYALGEADRGSLLNLQNIIQRLIDMIMVYHNLKSDESTKQMVVQVYSAIKTDFPQLNKPYRPSETRKVL